MGLRVYIFEEDPALLELLMLSINSRGHKAKGFSDRLNCPLYLLDKCACPSNKPCADAVIVSTRSLTSDMFQLLLDQEAKGCKLPNHKKAILSNYFTKEQLAQIDSAGIIPIKKPFSVAEIAEWLETCRLPQKL